MKHLKEYSFLNYLIKEYNTLQKLNIKPKEESYIFNIHFVEGAFVEILGNKPSKFKVESILST